MRTINFHHVDNDALLAYSKFDPITGDACWSWSRSTRSGPKRRTLWLDMAALGMEPYDRFWVRDEITGEEYQWGQTNYVRIDPAGGRPRPEHAADTTEQRPNLLRRE